MSDPLHSVNRAGTSPVASPAGYALSSSALSSSALSIEDYARAVQARSEFVDFLLAPARGELAAAA